MTTKQSNMIFGSSSNSQVVLSDSSQSQHRAKVVCLSFYKDAWPGVVMICLEVGNQMLMRAAAGGGKASLPYKIARRSYRMTNETYLIVVCC